MAKRFPLEKEDSKQIAKFAFFKSILNYTRDKGPPPGYFELAIQHDLYREMEEMQKKETIKHGEEEKRIGIISLDQSISIKDDREMPVREILRSEPKSDWALIDEVIRDTNVENPVDNTILKNYPESDTEIATIMSKTLGKSMTKQAVRKRRDKNITPLLINALERKLTIKEEEQGSTELHRREPIPREEEGGGSQK